MLPDFIWQLRGKDQSGPNVVILGGTHGDELTGIELVNRMLKVIGLKDNPAGVYNNEHICGNLFLGFGNPAAIELNSRGASKERDLNRSFSSIDIDRPLHPDDPPDVIRAHELAPLFQKTDYLFDIHATSSPSEPFVCFGEYADGIKVYTPSSGYIVFQVAPYKINVNRRLFCIAQEIF